MDVKKCATFPVRAGMFMELVAKPIPKAIDDSTPKNLATNCSSSSWMSRFPAETRSPVSLQLYKKKSQSSIQQARKTVIKFWTDCNNRELLVYEIYPEVSQTRLNNKVPLT